MLSSTKENDLLTFEKFIQQAKFIAEREPILSEYLEHTIINSLSFGEAIGNLLAADFQGIIKESAWKNAFAQVYNGNYGLYDGHNIVDLMRHDLQVRICIERTIC